MHSFEVSIKPDWITSGYYVYVVTIHYKGKTYLYIGQTGDNNYHTARAPLYRIGGHFAKGTSTENQIIKYFKRTVLKGQELSPYELEQELKSCALEYKFWKVCDYNPKDQKEKEHKAKRMQVQAIEHYLIWHLQQFDKVVVFNKRVKDKFSQGKRTHFKNDFKAVEEKAMTILKKLGYEG